MKSTEQNRTEDTELTPLQQLMNMTDIEFTSFIKEKRGIYGKEHNKSVLQSAPQSLYEVEYKLKTSGRQWKHNLKNMLLLIESLKPFVITAKDDLRDFAISSHNARLVARFGTQRTVNNVLNTAVDLGLLVINNNRGCNNLTHIATTYIYNKQIEEYLMLIAEENSIAGAEPKNKQSAGGEKSSGKIQKTSPLSPISPIRRNLRENFVNPSNINEFRGEKSSLIDKQSSENDEYTINAACPDDEYMEEYTAGDEYELEYPTKVMLWKLCDKMKTSENKDHLTIAEAIESLLDFYEQNTATKNGGNKYTKRARIYSKQRISNVNIPEYMEALYNEYPQIKDYQEKIALLNENSKDDMATLTMKPNLKINECGTLTKTGIRAYNAYCSMRSADRKTYLNNLWGECNEYDRKASIHSLSYFLNNHKAIPEKVDIYPYLWRGVDKWCNEEEQYKECAFDNEQQRNNYKSIFGQRLFFCKTENALIQSLKNGDKKNTKIQEIVNHESFVEQVKRIRNNYYRLIQKTYDSEIFLHESCIMIDLCLAIQKRGYKVVNIFDCVYSNCPDLGEVCAELMPAIMAEYAEKYVWNKEEL